MITEDFLLLRKVKIRLLSRGQKLLYTYGVRVREREPIACIPQSIAHEAAREARDSFCFRFQLRSGFYRGRADGRNGRF
jgi:hypothetical protein